MYYHFHSYPEAKAFLAANEGAKAVVWGYPVDGRPFYSIFIPKTS